MKIQIIEEMYDENDQKVETVEQTVNVDLGTGCDHCAEEVENLEEQFLRAGANITPHTPGNGRQFRKDQENRGLVMFFRPDYNTAGYSGYFHVEILQQSAYTVLTEKQKKDEKIS